MTKEKFDTIVRAFIEKHGNIKKVDFTRDKNGLPSITYVIKYYGSMNELKLAFELKVDILWNRENIWDTLVKYSKINPEFKQADLTKEKGLPSLPCILSYYPEYKNFSEIKIALGLELNYELWTKEKVVEACRKYLETHSKITLKDLRKENGLPTAKVIYNFYGTMQKFQEEIGSEVSKSQEFISKEELLNASEAIISQKGSSFENRTAFLDVFPYSQSVIISRFGSFDAFVKAGVIVDLCSLGHLSAGGELFQNKGGESAPHSVQGSGIPRRTAADDDGIVDLHHIRHRQVTPTWPAVWPWAGHRRSERSARRF